MEETTKSVLCVLVGFFVTIQIGRWWSQTSRMPKLNKLAMELNAIMQIGKLVKSRGTSILGEVRNVEISGATSHDFLAVFALAVLAHSKINQIA